jgi:hypothetical protein
MAKIGDKKRIFKKISCFEELDILSGGLEVFHKDLRNTKTNLSQLKKILIIIIINRLFFLKSVLQ